MQPLTISKPSLTLRSNPIPSNSMNIVEAYEETNANAHLGSPGAFGIVKQIRMKGKDGSESSFAVKRMRIDTRERSKIFRQEVNSHTYLSENPSTAHYVPKFVDSIVVGNYGYIVQSYTPVIDLTEYLNYLSRTRTRFQEAIGSRIFSELIQAVEAFHTSNVLHNDIKPENILLKTRNGIPTGELLLIDFGTTCLESPCTNTNIKGSEEYWPNFVQENAGLRSPYNATTENYSLGKVLNYILDFTEGDMTEKREIVARNFIQPGLNEFTRRKTSRPPSPNLHLNWIGGKRTRKTRRSKKMRSLVY